MSTPSLTAPSSSYPVMYSHALLLRLFLSNSFFSVHVALQYLRLYSQNIGITHYLTRRLSDVPVEDLWDVWGSICDRPPRSHLLVSMPSKSVALERFVIQRSEQSTHLALLTFWFMQASLNDLALSKRNTPSFVVCQRVLHKCHEIIFEDPSTSSSPYSSLTIPFASRLVKKKVKPHFEPAIVGIGCILAGVPGLPQVTEEIGDAAIVQGQRETSVSRPRPVNMEDVDNDNVLKNGSLPTSVLNGDDQEASTHSDEDEEFDTGSTESRQVSTFNVAGTYKKTSTPQDQQQSHTRFTESWKFDSEATRTMPALVQIHKPSADSSKKSRPVDDPRPDFSTSTSHAHSFSTPVISDTKNSSTLSHLYSMDKLLQRYDAGFQRLLLRGHYLRTEVQFILELENISNKLLVVPRPARVSALRAELTSLNHRLPAEVCLPLWCHTSDIPNASGGKVKPHHRIVRIPPSEGVVLNSAERTPYLLIVEILHDDLDFETSKRHNVDILRKLILRNSSGHTRLLSDPSSFKTGYGETQPVLSRMGSLQDDIVLSQTSSLDVPVPEEEVDVVEQLYGPDPIMRDADFTLEGHIVVPHIPKNKLLDSEVWSKSSTTDFMQDSSKNVQVEPVPSSLDQQNVEVNGPSLTVHNKALTLEDYSDRMQTAAVMLAQLNANVVYEPVTTLTPSGTPSILPDVNKSSQPFLSWIPGSNLVGARSDSSTPQMRLRLQPAEAQAIRDRIMQEMLSLEEERMNRTSVREKDWLIHVPDVARSSRTADENIIRAELNRVDPSAIAFREPWSIKKKRIKASSPYGHLANWDCFSFIVKTGTDLRQEQLAIQLIREFGRIWKEENCPCWVRHFHILITGPSSGLVETITDAVSLHSIKKAEYARRMANGQLGYVTLFDYFKTTHGDSSSARFARAQKHFAQSLAGYSLVTYLLQIKDRHNGNILIDKDGHILHIDFGYMLSNSPGNLGFEAAPFKLPYEYVEVLGGIDGDAFREFKRLFREGFEAARKHCDRIITIVEMMQKDSSLPCFSAFKEQTSMHLRERFQTSLTHSLVEEHVERLIVTSLGSTWTRLYDSYQYYSQSIL